MWYAWLRRCLTEMNIGMIVAIPEEIGALFRSCGTPAGTEKFPGYTVYHYDIRGHAVHVVGSGVAKLPPRRRPSSSSPASAQSCS